MLEDVDETLRRLLTAELANIPGCPVHDSDQITFEPPSVAEAVQDGEAHVNLYLHDLRENLSLRDESYRVFSKPTEAVAGRKRAMVRMDLSYLVTVYAGDDPAAEHRLLSDVLGVFLRRLSVPEEFLTGSLEGQGANGVLLAAAQPDHEAYKDPPGLWQALGGRLRPALGVLVTAPFDPFETKWTRVVREVVAGVAPGAHPEEPRRPHDISSRVSVAGVVLDQESEQPISGAEVRIDGRLETAETDSGGFFYLLNLPPGPQNLHVRKRGYRVHELRVAAPPSGRVDQLEPAVVSLRRLTDAEWAREEAARAEAAWNAPGLVEADRSYRVSLSGRLRFSDGRPASRIPVRVGRQSASTDAEGFYAFFDLPPGEAHTVFADLPGHGEVEVVSRDGAAMVAAPGSGGGPEAAPGKTRNGS